MPRDEYREDAEAIVAYLKEQHLAVSRFKYRLHARYQTSIGKKLESLAGWLLFTLGEVEAKLDAEEQERLRLEALTPIERANAYRDRIGLPPIRTGPEPESIK